MKVKTKLKPDHIGHNHNASTTAKAGVQASGLKVKTKLKPEHIGHNHNVARR